MRSLKLAAMQVFQEEHIYGGIRKLYKSLRTKNHGVAASSIANDMPDHPFSSALNLANFNVTASSRIPVYSDSDRFRKKRRRVYVHDNDTTSQDHICNHSYCCKTSSDFPCHRDGNWCRLHCICLFLCRDPPIVNQRTPKLGGNPWCYTKTAV